MRTRLLFVIFLLLIGVSWACSPKPVTQASTSQGFFYLTLSPDPTLFLSDRPSAAIRKQIPFNPPSDCSFYAIRPSPHGNWIAVEWECSFGPAVELFDSSNGESRFALSDPTIDSRFLAWEQNGSALYLKIGTLSIPQTLRLEAATGKATELFISPFAYDLTDSPDGRKILYSLSKGIGFGSETWLAGPDGQNPSQLLVDAKNITGLLQYSPDGSQIAYIKIPDTQDSTPLGELWLMDSSGFNSRQLAKADAGRGFYPAWSPDGSKIAFIGRDQPDNPESTNLSIYSLAQEKIIKVAASPGTQPYWSPEGDMISFSSLNPLITGGDKISVWLYEISSGQVNRLVNGACCAGWGRY